MKTIYSLILFCSAFLSVRPAFAQIPIYNSYPAASAVIFLDFDGQTVNGTSWNSNGPIYCEPAGISNDKITEVFNRVAEDYRPFNINVTTDSTKYWSAPAKKRIRIIHTVSSSWYGNAGGVAYINSFSWGDNTPAFVFTALLNYGSKNIAEASSHEVGHTLGLRHQASYDGSCTKTSEYNYGTGSGEISWAPIMGVGYSKNLTLWNNGANPYGCTNFQDDLGIITVGNNFLGYRNDDHANTTETATVVAFTNNAFKTQGIIERPNDVDVIRFNTPTFGRIKVDALPFSVGSGNTGANIDIQMELMNGSGVVVGTYNPANLLSASIDTIVPAGTYYVQLRGLGNINAPNYASLGSYTINAAFTVTSALPLHKLEMKGVIENNKHKFNWEVVADEVLTHQSLEISTDGSKFTLIRNLGAAARNFEYSPT
ncbi:MAG TPA: zinc-dependent metalloprotease family protein, partial [Flavisolibacter sp.]|nr:zinc-dependent metalloprotease family protein [Flavisolibacter sp.]